ncbi:MAG TPA: hypothetical protein VIL46_09095, partial [Gemmataceae bacterium]
PPPLVDPPRPSLTDNSGRAYRERQPGPDEDDGEVRKSTLFPVAAGEPDYLFEAPPKGVEFLRLEVPVEAWGGTGVFRFTIPAGMIRDERVMPNLPGFRRGP